MTVCARAGRRLSASDQAIATRTLPSAWRSYVMNAASMPVERSLV